MGESDHFGAERIVNPYEERGGGWHKWVLLFLCFIGVDVWAYTAFTGNDLGFHSRLNYYFSTGVPTTDFSQVYARLGVEALPAYRAAQEQSFEGLTKLARNPCDRTGIYALAEDVSKNDQGWAADAYKGFAQSCGDMAEAEYRRGADLYMMLGRYDVAMDMVKKAISIKSDDPYAPYVKGLIETNLHRYADAIADFNNVIQIYKDGVGESNVGFQVYASMAKAYEAQSIFCGPAQSALGVLTQFVETHPGDASNATAQTMMGKYRARSECVGMAATTPLAGVSDFPADAPAETAEAPSAPPQASGTDYSADYATIMAATRGRHR